MGWATKTAGVGVPAGLDITRDQLGGNAQFDGIVEQ